MRGLSIFVLSLTACIVDPGSSLDPSGSGSGSGGDDVPQPQPQPQPAIEADGTYQVSSQFDVTVEAVLPQPAYDLVITLRNFSVAPARTLLDLAEAAGVPVVAELRDALPSALESRLEGWIDDQLLAVTLNGEPITQVAAEIAAIGETALTQFAVDSELVIAGDRATHRLTTLDFTPAGADVTIALGELPDEITSATTTAQHEGARLTIGDHTFGIPYGQYAWRAIESAVAAKFGAPTRELLGAAVNCPAVANAVASKCVLGVCVGHRAELTELCERGLDEVVAVARRKIEAIRFDAIHLALGTATLVDANTDGQAERLEGGIWTAEIDATQGLRPVPATFTAQR
jgi:hypothetical protein